MTLKGPIYAKVLITRCYVEANCKGETILRL